MRPFLRQFILYHLVVVCVITLYSTPMILKDTAYLFNGVFVVGFFKFMVPYQFIKHIMALNISIEILLCLVYFYGLWVFYQHSQDKYRHANIITMAILLWLEFELFILSDIIV